MGIGDKGTVLIVEDDCNTTALVAAYLEKEGFSTVVVHDGALALDAAADADPLLIILDIMLPGLDGWEICRTLRKSSDVPILMLTAREEEADRVAGLAIGADDYVVKPFSPRELVERVKAILRRSNPRPTRTLLSCQGLELDPDKRKVTLNRESVSLTGSEYKLLLALMSAPGRAFSREQLLNHFYSNGEAVIDRVIDVHIGKLRQKIEQDPGHPRFIITVRGYGYRFCDEAEAGAGT
ncbi:response regulator [Geomesophilobacter sediminis]|uniref:Response regulator transcription factor n=1 Tax=Geomesophilobacter sediminis TaxID=2798584 RepID=A0A8J7IPX5_9BACT|nr:response regulator transcription factor [Geomesophilobacter sediminis]MBJ6725763.1 response regulator transcription factor [Geomesophilobacter sediminis]